MMGDYTADDVMDQPEESGGDEQPQPDSQFDEPSFRAWYAIKAAENGLNQNPDDPQHFYDYRAAYTAGAKPDTSGHWPSQFKREGHPNLIVDGVDTRTGKPAAAPAKPDFVDEPDTYTDEPDLAAQPGWMSLAWEAVKGGASQMNPLPLLKQLYDETGGEFTRAASDLASGQPLSAAQHLAAGNPIAATTRVAGQMVQGIAASQWNQFKKAQEEYQKGNYSAALGHTFAGVLPVIGPGAAATGEEMREGFETGDPRKVAHAVGGGAAQVGSILVPGAVKTAQAKAATTIAPMIERQAEKNVVHAISPHVGAAKARFGNIAQESAPRLLREPGMNAWSDTALSEKVGTKTDTALATLNAAYDVIPNTRMYPTSPVVKRIDDALRKLTPMGISGEAVEPANRAARISALKQAREEIKGLGSNANIDTLRDLRMAWDEGAKKEFAPSIQQDWLKTRSEGSGWADARKALADYLAEREPHIKPLNVEYSFWRGVNDVMAAMEESERVRPNIGRQMVASAAGMATGGAIHGLAGMSVGMLLGPMVDVALTSGATTKIASARAMARLADAMRSGNQASQMSALRALAAVTGQGKQLDEALRQARGESPPRE